MTDRQPYPKDRDVLSNIMVKNMLLHAGWQIVILFTLIFGVGEVCSRDGQTCSPAALSNFKFMGTKPFAIPSGIFELVKYQVLFPSLRHTDLHSHICWQIM
jgi:hypothetical protein